MSDKATKIVVIGAVACGPKAAARARRRDPHADITIVDKGRYISYAGCGLPYYVAGAVPELDGLMTTSSGTVRNVEFFGKIKGIKVLLGTSAEKIDRDKKEVHIKNLESGETDVLTYDKLVIATGAGPVVPPIEGMDLKKVYTMRRPEDAQVLREVIEAGEADRICVIGAGRIGLELADAFGAQAVDTTIVELADRIIPTLLDPEMAEYVSEALKKEKVVLRLGEKVLRLEAGDDGAVAKVITDKGEIETDAVLVGVGVRPDSRLAKEAGLEIGPTGAIAVDDHMRTSDPDIYAGGDCAENTNIVTGKKVFNPLGSVANRHGRVIGTNVTGGNDTFPGVLGTSVMKTLGIAAAKTGLTEEEAVAEGHKVVTSLNPSGDKSHFFPGGKYVLLKVVADAGTGKVLGAQAVGSGDLVRQIDTIATAITFGATVEQMAKLDLCYAPPFASAISNVAHSSNIIRNKIEGLVVGISPTEFKEKIRKGENFVVLDLRADKEREAQPLKCKEALCIPQEELRSRLDELPRDKEVVVGCQIGVRAYDSISGAIKGSQCRNVKLLEGGWHMFFGCGYDD